MTDRAQALADALRSRRFGARADHDVVRLADAPEHTEASVRVGADVDGYRCCFVALPEHDEPNAWAKWTLTVREAVAEVWLDVERFDVPAPRPGLPSVPPSPVFAHAYPLGPLVDDRLVHAYQAATRERTFALVREWLLRDDSPAPSLTWHRWAASTAEALGVARGWAGLPAEVDDMHPAAQHVHRVFAEAAKREPLPGGIVALDLRGLSTALAETLLRALVAAARERAERGEPTRGAVVLCESATALCLARTVPLDL